MMHSFFSSKKTDWYIESLGEHIVDILHSGLSLRSKEILLVTEHKNKVSYFDLN